MSKVLLDLREYAVTDAGEVIARYDHLVERLRAEKPIAGLKVFRHEDVEFYNQRRTHEHRMVIQEFDNEITGPAESSHEFDIPQRYFDLDLDEYLVHRLVERFPDLPDPYTERLILELDMMRERRMEKFLRALIYMAETFEQKDVLHGVGRGSACASLVLYLIGLHLVDPIRYDIPIDEFLR